MSVVSHDNLPAPLQLFDAEAVEFELGKLAEMYDGRQRELRTAVAQQLKGALAKSRFVAEQLLLKDRQGLRCAERLCFVQDEIIRVLHEFTSRRLYPAR